MKKKLIFAFVATALMLCSLQKTNAQEWKLGGNIVASDTTLGTQNAYDLKLITDNAIRMRINHDGRVAIGTNSTSKAKFTVDGAVSNTMAVFGSSLRGISLVSNNPTIGFNNYYSGGWKTLKDGYSGWVSFDYTAGNMQFATCPNAAGNVLVTPSVRMTILQNGNVGIGTTTPSSSLHVAGTETLSGNLNFTSDALSIQFANPGASPKPMMYMFTSGIQNTNRMIIAHSPAYPGFGLQYNDLIDQFDFLSDGKSVMSIALGTGNVGIGTSAPTAKLQVNGNEILAGNLNFTNGNQSIQFANPGATPQPMMYMFASGSTNTNRMVIAHSPTYPDWGLQYNDANDQFIFFGKDANEQPKKIMSIGLGTGYVGIGKTSPATKLDITGGQWDLDNSEGDFKIGNSLYRLKIGVATGGLGAGDVRIRASGGTKRLMLGVNDALLIDSLGNIGVGAVDPAYKLDVCGTIRSKEVIVQTGWCDYVFDKEYQLKSIDKLEQYINENKHLPGIVPASEVEKEGLKVAEMNKAMMEKIEELSLYVIQLSKDNKKLQEEIDALKK